MAKTDHSMTTPAPPAATPADALRRQIRTLRRALSHSERQQAAQTVARQVAHLRIFTSAHHIAGFLAFDGEMDPAPLMERAWEMGKQVYLPIVPGNPQTHMMFAPYRPDSTLRPNRFGISEPDVPAHHLLSAARLDLVITPLVAFDDQGTRMGMGGGFYDRTFAFRRNPGHLPKPHLLGIAYEFQKVSQLIRQDWDIPLDGIVTEAHIYPGSTDYEIEPEQD